MIESESLRRWQRDAFERYEDAGHRGIIKVATGGGKTLFSLYAFEQLKASSSISNVLVVVPTTALQDQWYVNFREDLLLADGDIATLNSRSTDAQIRQANVIVINSARDLHLSSEAKRHFLLIVDECHRAGSPENAKSLAGSWGATLGLSATPERQYDDGTSLYLEPALGPTIYTYSVSDALRDGVLSRFELRNIQVPLLPREREEIDRLTRRIAKLFKSDADDEKVEALLRLRARTYNGATYRVPTVVHLMEEHRSERTIIFHESIAAAEEIHALLKDRGHSVAIYHSKVSAPTRRENLRLFRLGVIDILVTCRALDEGANVPETRIAVIAASTASLRQRIQRLGRVLRPYPGKDFAVVYSLFATSFERDRLEREIDRLEGLAQVTWLQVNSVQ